MRSQRHLLATIENNRLEGPFVKRPFKSIVGNEILRYGKLLFLIGPATERVGNSLSSTGICTPEVPRLFTAFLAASNAQRSSLLDGART